MARWTGTWLDGPGVTLGELRDPSTWPGSRIGLPKEGSGSVAPFSVRAMGFFIDIVGSALVGALVAAQLESPSGAQRQLCGYVVLVLEQVLLIGLTGQSLGMRLMDIKVLRIKAAERPPGFLTALVRTVPLVLTVGLAGFFTRDGRGLHDLAAGSIVVRD
jgi:uncharacterized RDD family membrane protein YckC